MSVRPKRRPVNRGYFFVAPATIYFTALVVFPALFVLYVSVQTGSMYTQNYGWGIDNYLRLLQDLRFRLAAQHTVIFALLSTIFHILFAFLLAVLLNSVSNKRFAAVCRTLILVPWAMTPVVVGELGRLLYHPQFSPLSILIRAIPGDITWAPLGSTATSLLACAGINIWYWTPYNMLMVHARLQSVDPATYEAAQVDGANIIQQWRYIALPETRRLLLTLAAFDLAASAMTFDLIWVMTAGGPAWSTELLSTLIFQTAFYQLDFGYAASMGLVLAVIAIGLSVGALRFMRGD